MEDYEDGVWVYFLQKTKRSDSLYCLIEKPFFISKDNLSEQLKAPEIVKRGFRTFYKF